MFIIKPDNIKTRKTVFTLETHNQVLLNALEEIKNLNPEDKWTIEINPFKLSKTDQQRKYYHKLLGLLTKYTGESMEWYKVKHCFQHELVHYLEYKGITVKQRLSTEKLRTDDYAKLIGSAIDDCEDAEINYPLARNYYGMNI